MFFFSLKFLIRGIGIDIQYIAIFIEQRYQYRYWYFHFLGIGIDYFFDRCIGIGSKRIFLQCPSLVKVIKVIVIIITFSTKLGT